MTGSENESLFHKDTVTDDTSSYCQQFISDDCVSYLTEELPSQAKENTVGDSEDDVCANMRLMLETNLEKTSNACSALEKSKVRAVPLTGPSAAEPLTDKQNSSSNCHPTLPKSNDLTLQFAYNISSSYEQGQTASAIGGETPILSMFWSTTGDKSASIDDASIQLSCLRPIDKSVASENTKNTGEGGAIPVNGGSNLLGAAVVAGVAVLSSWFI